MKKSKIITFTFLGILLFIPIIGLVNAQSTYVGITSGEEYVWDININIENWNTYNSDNVEQSLDNVWGYSAFNLTRVYNDWSHRPAPQSTWPFIVTSIGDEQTSSLFSPIDNSTISYVVVSGTFGWYISSSENGVTDVTRNIVNDTSSFLIQSRNLSYSRGPYHMFEISFAPTSLNWSNLVDEFLEAMEILGGLYNNISATAKLDGYILNIPSLGFTNNTEAISIEVTYSATGVLSYYSFSYGGQLLLTYSLKSNFQEVPVQYFFMFIGLAAILVMEIVFYFITRE